MSYGKDENKQKEAGIGSFKKFSIHFSKNTFSNHKMVLYKDDYWGVDILEKILIGLTLVRLTSLISSSFLQFSD